MENSENIKKKSLKLQTKSASKGLEFWNIRILNVFINAYKAEKVECCVKSLKI